MKHPTIHRLSLVSLAAILLTATGCAHDRHTHAVIGGIIGAGIGYVIATESQHHDQAHHKKHRDTYHHRPAASRHHPPPRGPYCP